jgi:predicted extracellular nuclease
MYFKSKKHPIFLVSSWKNMILMFLGVFVFSLSTSCISPSLSQEAIDVVFYNVENLFDTRHDNGKHDKEFTPKGENNWTKDRYEMKINRINQVISQYENIGLMGLCEIENQKVLKDLIKGRENLSIVHQESNDYRGIDVALLYDQTKFQLLNSGIIRFTLEKEDRTETTRDILWAELQSGTEKVHVIVNHWPSRRGGLESSEKYRLKAAGLAREYIDKVLTDNPDANIIFMGDLNDEPDNNSAKMIQEKLRPQITRSSGKFGGTYNYRGDWNLLDHMMVSKGLENESGLDIVPKSGKISDAEFLITEYKGDMVPKRNYAGPKYLNGYSDHLPVSFKIQLIP